MRTALIAVAIMLSICINDVIVGAIELNGGSTSIEEVPASMILSKINDGISINLDHKNIIGDLDLSLLDLRIVDVAAIGLCSMSRVANSSMRITNSNIIGDMNLDNTVFTNSIDFSGTSFHGDTRLVMAQFRDEANFAQTHFYKNANFGQVQFYQDANFAGAKFDEEANFREASFEKDAKFSNDQFSKEAGFSGAIFAGDAYFTNAKFVEDIDLAEANFSKEVFFRNVQFDGSTNFRDTEFHGDRTDFMSSKFSKSANFKNANFTGDAWFIGARFIDVVDFTDVNFKGNLSFTSTEFYKESDFNKANFYSYISLNHTKFNGFRVHWNSIKNHSVYYDYEYKELINNYKNIGWLLDASECYYDYRNYQREKKPIGISKLLDSVAWLYCGYGVRPGYTIICIVLLVLIFGIIYKHGDGIRRSGPPCLTQDTLIFAVKNLGDSTYQLNLKQEEPKKSLPLKDAIYFSAMTFASKDTGSLFPDGSHVYLAKIECILGGFLFGLFLIFFSGALQSYFLQP